MKRAGKEKKRPSFIDFFDDKISQNEKNVYFCNLFTGAIDEKNNMTDFLKTD